MNGTPDVFDAPVGAAQIDIEGAVRPLLMSLLTHASGFQHTPLRFGIDSAGIVDAALVEIFGQRIGETGPIAQHWEAFVAGFDALLAVALVDDGNSQAASNRQSEGAQFSLPGGGRKVVSRNAGGEANGPAVHPLVAWIERFHAALRGVHLDAIEIARLRLDGYTSREIAERLELGLRLVARILQDMRLALAGGMSP